MSKAHPWELAWREGRWEEASPPLAEVVEYAKSLKRKGAKWVLDVGCGAGRHSILLGKEGFQGAALDISETALKTLEGRLKSASMDNITLVKQETWGLQSVEDYFHVLICATVSHHGRLLRAKGPTLE